MSSQPAKTVDYSTLVPELGTQPFEIVKNMNLYPFSLDYLRTIPVNQRDHYIHQLQALWFSYSIEKKGSSQLLHLEFLKDLQQNFWLAKEQVRHHEQNGGHVAVETSPFTVLDDTARAPGLSNILWATDIEPDYNQIETDYIIKDSIDGEESPIPISHKRKTMDPPSVPVGGSSPEREKKIRKKINKKNRPEKRLSRYRSSPSKALLERIDIAMDQRMYLILTDDSSNDELISKEYLVLGPTGSVYTVKVSNLPSCNCPDSAKGHHCAHILFVLLKVLKVKLEDPVLYQRALLNSELSSIYESAPLSPKDAHRERVKNGTFQPGVRQPLKECIICQETLAPNKLDAYSFCDNCGDNYHKECANHYHNIKLQDSAVVCCPICDKHWVRNSDASFPYTARNNSSQEIPNQ